MAVLVWVDAAALGIDVVSAGQGCNAQAGPSGAVIPVEISLRDDRCGGHNKVDAPAEWPALSRSASRGVQLGWAGVDCIKVTGLCHLATEQAGGTAGKIHGASPRESVLQTLPHSSD
jgi:hypothetical protein